MLLEYQLIIRNAANDADALEITSVRAGTNPYISNTPTGEGATLDWLTGKVTSGSMSIRVVDPITSGTARLLTSQLEDANERQQLGHRRAFLKFRQDGGAWTTLYAGRVTMYRLISDIEWEITVGDWMKAEHEISVFDAQHREKTTTENEIDYFADIVADYLTLWPNRGCILGGPMYGPELDGWPAVRNLGGWQFRVTKTGTAGHKYTQLNFVSGYYPNGEVIRKEQDIPSDEINEAVRGFIRHMPSRSAVDTSVGTEDIGYGEFDDVAVLIDGVARRASNAMMPLDLVSTHWDRNADSILHHGSIFLVGTATELGLTVGQLVRVHIITAKVSDASPVYWTGHPCDFLSRLWTVGELPYDSASLANVKGALGADLRMTIRAAKPWNLGEIAEKCVYGPFGVGARSGSDGEIEVFTSRIFANTPPATTIEDSDVSKDETDVFDLDASEAVKHVAFTHEKLIPNVATPIIGANGRPVGTKRFLEPFTRTSERFERTNDDPGSIGEAVHEFEVPCMIHAKNATDGEARSRFDGRAHEIFDRTGRGPIRLKTLLLRGQTGSSSVLGQEVAFDLSAIPNHNKRLGDDSSIAARAMQLLHVTWRPEGLQVEALDSGPNAQPLSTKPTHTIAASTNAPRNVAALTITNAAALNALSYAVRVQMAVVNAGGADPATTDYTDALYIQPGVIPTTAIGLPAVFAGKKVFVRARSEKHDSRPSDWSTPVSVTLTAFTAPSALNATADAADGSRCDLEWTNGTANCWTEVWLRLNGQTFAQAVLQDLVPRGANDYRIYGLTPNTQYIASVRHVDMVSGDRTDTVDDSFTTANLSLALNPPIEPRGFSDERSRIYGLSVVAQNFPSIVEFWEAAETAPGAGTYGAYAKLREIPAEFGDDEWTTFITTAARDRLRRKLKAREFRNGDGSSPSAFTSEVVVSPWTDVRRPPRSSPQGTVNVAADGVVRIALDGPLTIGSYRWQASTSAYPADATVESAGTIAAGRSQNDLSVGVTLDIGQRVYITVVPFSGTGAQGTAGAPIHLTATRGEPQAAPQGTINIAADGVVKFAVDGPLSALSYKWQASSSAYPADATVQASGAVLNGRVHSDVSSGITLDIGQRVYITIVPFTGASAAGSAGQSIHLTGTRAEPQAAPQGTVAIASDGSVKFSVDGPLSALSYKWQASSSSYPADATVQASGATLNGRIHNDVSSGITLSLGQRVYITLVPYTGASAAGTAGQSIHLTATRHDFSATKTAFYAAHGFRKEINGGSGTLVDSNAYISPSGMVFGDFPYLISHPLVPSGVTITTIEWYAYQNATVNAIRHTLDRLDKSAGWGYAAISGDDWTSNVGQQVVTSSVSEDTTDRRYRATVAFSINDAADQADVRFSGMALTWTMPTSDKTL